MHKESPQTVSPHWLLAHPLTPAAFAPFGHVVAIDDQVDALPQRSINGGNAQRFDLLADMQLTADGGVHQLALFRAQARPFPLAITQMERHALGSQTFVPLGTQRFVVVVARPGTAPQAGDLHAFVTNGRQGVVLAPGAWHHALLAVEGGDFVVIERQAQEVDCDVCSMATRTLLVLRERTIFKLKFSSGTTIYG